jgi:hypothetical protein
MKTIQFNANQILNRNHQPITHNGVIIMASNMVIISTGHDDSIISDPEGYQEYIIPILEAIQKTSIKVYRLYLASITSTVTDYKGTHTWVFTTGTTYSDADIKYIQAALYNVFCENNDQCEPIVNYVNNTFIITDIYSC